MTLADDIASALPEFRAAAESLMADMFTAYGAPAWGKVDGLDEEARAEQYSTRGKVSGRTREGDTNARTETVGGVERPVIEGGIHIPLSAALPAIGWEFVCTETGPASDPSLVGRRWRVIDVPAKSYATARRLDVVEISQEAP